MWLLKYLFMENYTCCTFSAVCYYSLTISGSFYCTWYLWTWRWHCNGLSLQEASVVGTTRQNSNCLDAPVPSINCTYFVMGVWLKHNWQIIEINYILLKSIAFDENWIDCNTWQKMQTSIFLIFESCSIRRMIRLSASSITSNLDLAMAVTVWA